MRTILAVNAGSTSLKLAVYSLQPEPVRDVSAAIDRIGRDGGHLVVHGRDGRVTLDAARDFDRHTSAFDAASHAAPELDQVEAIGHRIVRGGPRHNRPMLVTPELIDELRAGAGVDPQHGPSALDLLSHLRKTHPRVPQVACFDSAFHHTMPAVAFRYALPRRFAEEGVRRVGFHGLSCESIVHRLAALDPAAARGRVIVAHLGGGSSITALHDGRSVDTTMGFTPTGGLVMATRLGDVDPSVVLHLADLGLDTARIRAIVNAESGLLGLSGLSADMQTLLERETTRPEAAEAVAIFCYTARKHLGALAAALGGIDTLVFTGGIGEHAAPIRERICQGLGFIGLVLDDARNAEHGAVISAAGSRVVVRVIATEEELAMARQVQAVLSEAKER